MDHFAPRRRPTPASQVMNRCSVSGVCLLLLVLCGLGRPAFAQGARGLPDPISSSTLAAGLLAAGLAESDLELMAGPLDRYLADFRTLRSGPIEDWLEMRRSASRGLLDADVEDRVEARLAVAGRIATLDERLFAELQAAGMPETVIATARAARGRTRSRTLIGARFTRGLRFEPTEIYRETCEKITESPQWALDGALSALLEAHDRDRTTRLATLARTAMDLPIERARSQASMEEVVLDPESATPEDFERWFAVRREIEQAAAADVRELQASLLAADREILDRIIATTGTDSPFALAFRDAWLAAAHPRDFPDRDAPRALFENARTLHEDGRLDAETFEAVSALETSWSSRHRAIEDRLLRGLEQATRTGDLHGGAGVFLTLEGELDEAEPSELEVIRRSRAALDQEIRTAVGGVSPEFLASRNRDRGSIDLSAIEALEGVPAGITMSIAVVGEAIPGLGDGEPVMLELDDLDLGDGAIAVSTVVGDLPGIGGPMGLPRPLDTVAFRRFLDRVGADEVTTPILDRLFAEYRIGWEELDETLVAEWKATPRGGFVAASGTDDDIARAASLRSSILDAVLSLDARFFDDAAIVVEDPGIVRRLADRRRRSACIDVTDRGPFATGGRVGGVDLDEVLEDTLAPEVAARLAGLGEEWSRTHTPLVESRARATIEIDRDLAIAQASLQRMFEQNSEGDGEAVLLDTAQSASAMKNMNEVQGRRSSLEQGLNASNTEWIERIAGTLAAMEPEAADAFRLGCDRRAWPSCFEDPRSPEANFQRALELDDLPEGTKVAIETLRNEWHASWLAACRRLVDLSRDGGFDPMAIDPANFDPVAIQRSQADRRRIRFERNELDEKAIRELHGLLSDDQREIVGDLPAERKRMLMPGMGDIETIIGG